MTLQPALRSFWWLCRASIWRSTAGPHSFYRGGSLTTYDAETRKAIAILGGRIDGAAATEIWELAVAAAWRDSPVWIHGDVSAGNLLVQDSRLSSVIDFGMLAVGDPACDLSIAWTLFGGESRKAFRAALPSDTTWTCLAALMKAVNRA